MSFTISQKKQAFKPILDRYYAPVLEQAGFQSYQGEGFHWYKVKNGLLYKIHLPFSMSSMPLDLQIGFAVLPLFSWEEIPLGLFVNDWGRMLSEGGGHYTWVCEREMDNINQLLGRSFPRKNARSYFRPLIYYHTHDGILIGHLNTETRGAELLSDVIIPSLQALDTLESIYEWNKRHVYQRLGCTNNQELCRILQDKLKYNETFFLSSALADQCIYFHDIELFPGVQYLLQKYLVDKPKFLENFPPKTKKQLNKENETLRHARVLLSGLESGDEAIFQQERDLITQMMTAQIKHKLPGLLE